MIPITPWMIYKDVGMFLYELAKSNNWQGKYLYFNTTYFTKDWNEEFAKYVEPICIGEAIDGKNQKRLAWNWIKKHAKELDVLMLFNYGSTNWKLARLAKKINPNMKKNLKIVSHQFILFMFTDKIFIKKESNF